MLYLLCSYRNCLTYKVPVTFDIQVYEGVNFSVSMEAIKPL